MNQELVKELNLLIESCDDNVLADALIKDIFQKCLEEIVRLDGIIERYNVQHNEWYGRKNSALNKDMLS